VRSVGKKAKKRAALVAETFAESPSYSVSDPALAEFFGLSSIFGVNVTEANAMGLTAVYRAVSLISGTIAGLPLKVYEGTGPTRIEHSEHWLTTDPAGPYDLSSFSWTEMVLVHLLLHGESFLKSIHNEGGQLIGLYPVHPNAVTDAQWDGADKRFRLQMATGQSEWLYTGDITQVLGISADGLRGMSPLSLFSNSLNTMRASETAANRSFTSGALIAGLVTTEEDVDLAEAQTIKASLDAKMMGASHAGDIAFVNRALKFSPWTFSARDAQFLESRAFGVEEAARIYGLPLNLMSVGNVTSNWGTGVSEANLGLQKYVLTGWTSRLESALRAVLPLGWYAEFEYAGLLQGTPKDEIELLLMQTGKPFLTVEEARAIRNLPPLTPDQMAELSPPPPPQEMTNGNPE
jgi:HK97 family phage portal protein